MHLVGEQEGDTDLVEDAAQIGWLHVQVDAEGLDDVRGTGLRGGGTVAVLDQGNTHRCRDNRGHGRDVDGLVAVSAGADDVESAAGQVDAGRVILHAVGQAVNLLDGGALDRHGGEEGGQASLAELAAHDLVHEPVRLVVVQRFTGDQGGDDRGPVPVAHRAAPRSTSATVS